MKTFSEVDGFESGPSKLLILGPPGTGKTTAALNNFLVPALKSNASVLCCSFSNAAAGEMRSRAATSLQLHDSEIGNMCSTIHSQARRQILKLREDWMLFDGISQTPRKFTKSHVSTEHSDPDSETKSFRGIVFGCWDFIRNLMKEDDSEWVTKYLGQVGYEHKWLNLDLTSESMYREIYRYESEKRRHQNYVDFTDILAIAQDAPPVEADLLLIDEAQDCTPLQWQLLDHWAKHCKKVVVIGDPDQAVHEWMGASPERIEALPDRGFEVRYLSQSYRVPKAQHKKARFIITQTKRRFDPQYLPNDEDGRIVPVVIDEAVEMARKCSIDNVDMFILTRTKRQLNEYASALRDFGVPFIGERCSSPMNAHSQARVIKALFSLKNGDTISPIDARHLLSKMKAKYIKGTRGEAVSGIANEELHYDMHTMPIKDDLPDRIEDCFSKNTIKYSEELTKIASTYGPDMLSKKPSVVLTTFHSSKGREAPVVAIHGGKPRRYWGSINIPDEELRCLYVAMTRSKYLTMIIDTGKKNFKPWDELICP